MSRKGGKRLSGGLDYTTMLEPLGSDLWFADGGVVSFKGFDYPTRMVVVRLADGGLWLWSPVERTAAIEDEIRALGPVRHIVSPNKLHYLFLGEWQSAQASARAKGAERFEGFMQTLGRRLATGDRFLKELSRDIDPSGRTSTEVDEGA